MDAVPYRHRDSISISRTASTSSSTTPTSAADSPSFASSGSQSLASILNNPLASRSDASWSLWWPSGPAGLPDPLPPIVPTTPIPEVSRSDFQQYLSLIAESYSKFEDVRNHTSKERADSEIRGQGEALVACLREVPSLFFKEDFALEEGETFRAACPFSPLPHENAGLQEKLSHYLDVVEMHLVKEISLRSDSFFEAQGKLQGLDGEIVEACVRIRELKETIRILTTDLVDSAKQVQELNATRGNLVALQQKLTVILYVSQALSALKLLVASSDCAGALDVIDDLQNLLDSEELAGLHCFRHLRDELATSMDSINSILSAEFMHVTRHNAKDVDSAILLKFKRGNSNAINGVDEKVISDEEDSSIFRDNLLPLIICLLRTAKLPSVLRIYRDTLISDMKMSIKSTVAELLPILVSKPLDSAPANAEVATNSDGGGLSLASKLRNLSSESFVQLLLAIFKVVKAHLVRAAEVKRVIEWIMGNLDGCDAADSVTAAVAIGAAVAAAAESSQVTDASTILSSSSLSKSSPKVLSFYGKTTETSNTHTTKNFRADVLRENTEAVFAACDAAHGRWAKLLGVRALLHPKLRLPEFLSIYNITQDFITSTEKMGGRLGYSIRGTLQSQSKAFVDFQHESRVTKIKAVLDQETWVVVDVPEEFQAIVDLLSCESLSKPDGPLISETVLPYVGQSNEVTNHAESPVDQGPKSEVHQTSQSIDGKVGDQGRATTSQKIVYKGVGYHMVNCGLILLKMLAEYIDISKFLPALCSEVVHRIVELLKHFNTRTCQLVLGAGAMQVSGLKSITSKHLALASQIISFIYAVIPDIRQVLFLKIPESRKGLLLFEFERVSQDYRVHRDEIHSKLVQIMRERLLANLRKLPQIAETWNGPEDPDPQPSQFARSVTKEVTYLHRILSQTLLETDVQTIFRQVVQIFHSLISEAFSNIETKTPQAKDRLHRDVKHILGCIRKLPSDNSLDNGVPNFGLLDEFMANRFTTKDNL